MLKQKPTAFTFKHFALQKPYTVFDTPVIYGYPRGASGIVTVSPLWLFPWSLCYWTKNGAFDACFDHIKWSGKEKPIMMPWCPNSAMHRFNTSSRKAKAQSLSARPTALTLPLSSGETPLSCAALLRMTLKVINIGNVPVMGISVPSNHKGTGCISCFWQLGWLEFCLKALQSADQ